MWIEKEIVPLLIDAVERILEAEAPVPGADDDVAESAPDPNDPVIFRAFVLPALHTGLDKGFDSGDMLAKGFRFLMNAIPWYLRERAEESLVPSIYGKLVKAYVLFALADLAGYVSSVPDEYVRENLSGIKEKIDRIKRI